MSSYEKAVKGATKLKLAPPKSKYIEQILEATHRGEQGVADVFRTLHLRLRDSTWTIAFKALIVVHLMIREGEQNVTIRYLSNSPRKLLNLSNYTEIQTQGRNIKSYTTYLVERARSFARAKIDYVASGEGRLKRLSVEKGLLMETESVQTVIGALLRCELLSDGDENEITIFAFRLITMDLLILFRVMNEGAINVLEHYFEMSRPDAERALDIYKTFSKQTEQVVRFLSVARQFEASTRVEIPKLRHAPTSLVASLEEYLNDKDFEINRRQYLAQQEAKKSGRTASSVAKSTPVEATPGTSAANNSRSATESQPSSVQRASVPTGKGQGTDLIDFDFFESIEQNQQPMAQDPSQYQFNSAPAFSNYNQNTGAFAQQQYFEPSQTGAFAAGQSTNPFGQPQQQQGFQSQFGGPSQFSEASSFSNNYTGSASQQIPHMQQQYTGAGFGGYTPQSQRAQQPYSSVQPPPTQTGYPGGNGYNPYTQHDQLSANSTQAQRQATNPFRQSTLPQQAGHSAKNPFAPIPESSELATNSFQQPFQPRQQPSPFSSTSSPFGAPTQSPTATAQQRTGTNPFARTASPPQQPQPSQQPQQQPQAIGHSSSSPFANVTSQAAGGTNPFRQSAFVNQQTGRGWQTGPQGSMGGLENLPTVPVFPRPGQQNI